MPGNEKGRPAQAAPSESVAVSPTTADQGTPASPADGGGLALDATWPMWRAAATEHLEALASSGREFTADDLVELVGLPAVRGDANALGGLFRAAARNGLIQRVGYRRSRRAARAGGVQAVWRGASS